MMSDGIVEKPSRNNFAERTFILFVTLAGALFPIAENEIRRPKPIAALCGCCETGHTHGTSKAGDMSVHIIPWCSV